MSSFTFGNNSYQIINNAKTWIEAKAYSESIGGYLAIINSQDENDAIIAQALNFINSSNIVDDGGGSRYIWLGGSDMETEGVFKWINGSLFEGYYTNWGSGFLTEPDDYEGQDSLAMALEQWPANGGGIGKAGKWNDIDENNLLYFVVEFNPTFLESGSTATLSEGYITLLLTGSAKINGTGNSLDNVMTGNSASNFLYGLTGNDTLDGGLGSDNLIGGQGNDTYYVDASKDIVTEKVNEGTDHVYSSVTHTLGKEIEQLTLIGNLSINAIGNALANNITGNVAANLINGGTGNDTIISGDGNDTIIGGKGDDTIYAEGGNDTITTTSGLDWVYGGDGNDKLTGSKDNDHLEGDSGDDTIFGAAGNDALWGSNGNDIIKGDAGTDHIWGGSGNDTLTGGNGNDRFHFGELALNNLGVDTITDFKGDEIYLYSNPFTNHSFISVNLLSEAQSGEGIIYEKSSGTLYYDQDGAGSGELGIAFAILTGKPDITISNFSF